MAKRKRDEMAVPMVAPMSWNSWTRSSSEAAEATAAATRVTTVEWPMAKQKPTATGALMALHELAG